MSNEQLAFLAGTILVGLLQSDRAERFSDPQNADHALSMARGLVSAIESGGRVAGSEQPQTQSQTTHAGAAG